MDPELEKFRNRIDGLDAQIVALLAERLDVCAEVGVYKRRQELAVMRPDRVEAVKSRCAEMAASRGLRPAFARALYGKIIEDACDLEARIMGAENGAE